jgi:predicted phage gp36 major capsid-like protein
MPRTRAKTLVLQRDDRADGFLLALTGLGVALVIAALLALGNPALADDKLEIRMDGDSSVDVRADPKAPARASDEMRTTAEAERAGQAAAAAAETGDAGGLKRTEDGSFVPASELDEAVRAGSDAETSEVGEAGAGGAEAAKPAARETKDFSELSAEPGNAPNETPEYAPELQKALEGHRAGFFGRIEERGAAVPEV